MENREVISKLTLEEKAGLMSGKDFWQTKDVERLGISNMFLSDGPHGIRKQAKAADHLGLNASIPATCFPTAATMANSWNEELGEELGRLLGEEAVAQKVNVLLGPGLNIKRNPLCGRNFEYFSEDPFLAGKMAAAYVRGIQSNGISACLKHFAANNQEYRRMSVDSIVDERALREIYLTGFEIAAKEGKVRTIMSSYNLLNGTYTNENKHLLKDILRDEWGYKGIVVTDWGGSNDRVDGIKAGNELEMPTTGGETDKEIIVAIKEGRLKEEELDECVDRLLTLIFDTERLFKDENRRTEFDVEAHHDFARRAAEESVVLLRNEKNILPLDSNKRVAIIGDFASLPRYQGAGSSIVNPTKLDNALNCIDSAGLRFAGYERGFLRYGKKKRKLIKRAVKLSSKAETLLVYLGLDEFSEVEGLDRENMSIPENQLMLLDALIKTGKEIIVVLSCGASVEMPWAEKVSAIVYAGLGGQAGAKAVLNIISGKINPSGKLSESYPFRYEDCPSATYFPGMENTAEYRESVFIGYRYYDTAGIKVRYPFGFGLSYTSFEYSDIDIGERSVRFKLKNTGERDGAEVVQLYVGAQSSKLFRAKKELKGFKKVFLRVGESKEVEIPFDDKTFRYFNTATNNWEIEPTTYIVSIGSSINDIKLSGTIEQGSEEATIPYNKSVLQSYYSAKVSSVTKKEYEDLLGKPLPDPHFKFYKRKRLKVDYNTTVAQLRYARGWSGRFFAWGIRVAIRLLRGIGQRANSNTIIMGVYHQPMRGMSRMTGGALSWAQLNGLITMFNGKFFKGLGQFLKAGKQRKREQKLLKKEQKRINKGQ